MFHGSPEKVDIDADNPHSRRYDLCLVDDPDVAAEYGEVVHSVELGTVSEAQPSEIDDVIEDEFGERPRDWWDRVEWLDDPSCQEALIARGYNAAKYPDVSPNNQSDHECLRILDADIVQGAEVVGN